MGWKLEKYLMQLANGLRLDSIAYVQLLIITEITLLNMSVQMYFVNETKKQVVDTKKLYGDFEDNQQLLCYLNMCQGDSFRTEFENSEWIESFIYDNIPNDYKHIRLYEFDIKTGEDLHQSKEYHRLYEVVNAE